MEIQLHVHRRLPDLRAAGFLARAHPHRPSCSMSYANQLRFAGPPGNIADMILSKYAAALEESTDAVAQATAAVHANLPGSAAAAYAARRREAAPLYRSPPASKSGARRVPPAYHRPGASACSATLSATSPRTSVRALLSRPRSFPQLVVTTPAGPAWAPGDDDSAAPGIGTSSDNEVARDADASRMRSMEVDLLHARTLAAQRATALEILRAKMDSYRKEARLPDCVGRTVRTAAVARHHFAFSPSPSFYSLPWPPAPTSPFEPALGTSRRSPPSLCTSRHKRTCGWRSQMIRWSA